ncbi:hypothetical protein H0H81_004798 [Sphagnurus paluster]|uniref:Uncharacterized protein n=1 Tax=Sphagnurus paluster TaxID=117069 RepID=A0A9P7FSL5_9AGAR|nr:hypothetical protein H0H81_004798 [Sphagnurus paluster]
MSEGVIQTVQHSGNPPRARAFFISSDDLAPPLPKKSTMYPPVPPVPPLPTALSTPTTAETPELPLQVPTPTFTASSPFSAASILMHPWHAERKRRTRSVQLKSRFSTDVSDIDETGSETKSPTSFSRGSARNSYMSDMSVPPLPPLIGPVQRYSSATLTSPAVSQHSREGQPRYKVRLLTFESNFRTGRTSSPAISAMS